MSEALLVNMNQAHVSFVLLVALHFMKNINTRKENDNFYDVSRDDTYIFPIFLSHFETFFDHLLSII